MAARTSASLRASEALYGAQRRSCRGSAEPALLADACALMHSRVQRLVDMGRLRGAVDASALAVWAASQGVLSLVHQRVPRKDIEATSDRLFEAIIGSLGTAPG